MVLFGLACFEIVNGLVPGSIPLFLLFRDSCMTHDWGGAQCASRRTEVLPDIHVCRRLQCGLAACAIAP